MMNHTHHKIYLIRHGETEWTVLGKHTGNTDIPLTAQGEEDAKKIRDYLKGVGFQKVLVSPLQRAKETCRLSGFFSHALIDEDLREWDYGRYEGLTTSEIRKENPSWTIFSQGAPDGESIADIGARANRVLGRVCSIPGDVAIFSSGHILRSIAARWLGMPVSFGKHLILNPASISILGFERETPALIQWNQTQFS
jgi:probable phosphoglycerate mutase